MSQVPSPLPKKLLPKNQGRPRSVADFDQRPGFTNLRLHSTAPEESRWRPTRWMNVAILGVAVIVAVVVWAQYADFAEARQDISQSYGKQFLLFVYCLTFTTNLLMLLGIDYCEMVIDRAATELRFTYGIWLRRRHVIRFGEIRTVQSRIIEDTGDCESCHPRLAVYVELFCGDLVLVAISPDYQERSLMREIEDAVASTRDRVVVQEEPPLLTHNSWVE